MATNDTFLQAAVQVLRAAGRPLTVAEITDEALRRQLIVPQGKTPRSSRSARLYTIARNNPKSPGERLFEPGAGRARRDSVRWIVRDQAAGPQGASTSDKRTTG